AEIFDLTYAPAGDAERWHPSVLAYDVMRGRGADQTRLGRIYLDMHPRDGKYKHAAQFPLKDGVRGVQLPEGVLVCNFPAPDPGGPGRPASAGLMEHDDVVTMFHEFGHLMHHVLGGHQRWISQSGQKRYTPFAYVPGTRFHASFGHLVGYSAMYYTYLWSLVIAKDLLTPFQARGLMSTEVTYAYRDKVLVPGGSRDAADLVRD